jgi:hypothetical protein
MSNRVPNDVPIRSLHSTRRSFLGRATSSVGGLALGMLLRAESADAFAPSASSGVAHLKPRAKRVIHLYMAGGPSHLETFDEKPKLMAMDGQPMPESITKGQQIAQLQGQDLKCFAPQFSFKSFGQSGQRISSLFPQLGAVADELAVIRSMKTEQINHDPAHMLFNTGSTITGRPSMGAWLTYGLGSESQDLPGFVVMTSVGKGGQAQPIAARQWSAGFLPSRYQGVEFRSTGDPVLYVGNPPGVSPQLQRTTISAVRGLNQIHHDAVDDPEILTRIAQYELAFRMQTSVPELMDLSNEPQSTFEMYGTQGGDGTFAANCLLARRLAERGVKFIQVYHRAWDHHGEIKKSMEITAREVDRPAAALIADLRQRGMLDDTLVLIGGEFGRTPMSQGGTGRDHHIAGYSYALAGGGVQGGISYGATDELGYHAVDNVTHIRDLQATILHLMGVDHERMSVRFQGLDIRLTGVEKAHVLRSILA